MLIKVGYKIINLKQVSHIDLSWIDYETKREAVVFHMANREIVRCFEEEAEMLRWYFKHPIGDVTDIKNLKG